MSEQQSSLAGLLSQVLAEQIKQTAILERIAMQQTQLITALAEELLEKTQHACMSAAWFWASRGLNTLADAGLFDAITRRINGGHNGAADRHALYARALKVLV